MKRSICDTNESLNNLYFDCSLDEISDWIYDNLQTLISDDDINGPVL